MQNPDPHNRGMEAVKLAHQYTWRQQKRLFPVTVGILTWMMGYSLLTFSFFPLFQLNILSWVILMAIMFWTRKKLNEEFLEYLKCQRIGKEMDWKTVVYNGWLNYAATLICLYWVLMIAWISFFMPEGGIYELYEMDPTNKPLTS